MQEVYTQQGSLSQGIAHGRQLSTGTWFSKPYVELFLTCLLLIFTFLLAYINHA